MLRRWDIIFAPADEKDAVGHPAVVLSHEARLQDDRVQRINVLVGSKKQPAAEARVHETILDGADGLDFPTLIDCSLVCAVHKRSIRRLAGSVSYPRRTEIQRKVREYLGLG